MRRREFISVVVGATAWSLAARAQHPAMPVVGYLAEVPDDAHLSAAFQRGMAEFGYVEGKNFATEYRVKPESLSQAAADLVHLKVSAIFAVAPAAVAAVSTTAPRSNSVAKSLFGTMNDLRSQTQKRLDQEISGKSEDKERDAPFVVHDPIAAKWGRLTSRGLLGDFQAGSHNDLNPVTPKLAVIKKNVAVMK